MKTTAIKEIIKGVQFGLLFGTSASGFGSCWAAIWSWIGFPKELWAILLTTVLGIFSTIGLIKWIRDT